MALDSGRIQNNIRKLRKIFKSPAKLKAPKRVHDLRTRTRRVEALLPAIDLDSSRNAKRLLRDLRPIRKRAGKLRDMDVLTAHLLELDVDRDNEGDCVVQLLEHLGQERHRQGKRLEREVRKRRADVRARLKRLSRDIASATQPNRNRKHHRPDAAAGPRVNASATAMELASELSDPKTLGPANLHPYRLKVKELRYILKAAEGNADPQFVQALGACKDAIGDWHDWQTLAAIATGVLDHGRACKLIEQLKGVTRRKFATALAMTNEMRSKFVTRQHNRPSAEKPIAVRQPGLEAANALAQRKLAS